MLAALLMLLFVNVVFAVPAQAHATLLFSTPTLGGAVPESPTELRLVFNEPVAIGEAPVRLVDGTGRQLTLAAANLSQGGRVLTVPVTSIAPRGLLTVQWQVLAGDGDPVGGSYQFAVGPAIAAATDTSTQRVDVPTLLASSVLRWVLFGSVALGLGGLLGFEIGARRRPPGLPLPAPPVGLAGIAGLAACLGLAWLVATAGLSTGGGSSLPTTALIGSRAGQLLLVEAIGFALVVVAAAARRRRWAVVPLLAVVAAEGFRSHPAQLSPGWGAALTAVHLVAAALWVGALVQVVRTAAAWRSRPGPAWAVVGGYARFAAWLFAAVVATGVVSALLLVPWRSWTTTPYGRVLLVKLVLVAGAAVLALLARTQLRASARTEEPAITSPGWAARTERVVLVGVLAVTAVLVSLPTPKPPDGSGPLPLPPPPVGLAVPLGARAGQVGISVSASAGQLVVHLTAPVTGNRIDGDDNSYQLTGVIHPAGGEPRKATWRGCGSGCFLAAATWADGSNQITLQAAADAWTGGTVSLTVPWPARSGADQLRRTTAAMKQVRELALYEEVSSNTATATVPIPLSLSGADFLDTELYSAGVAPQAVVTESRGGLTTLLVGFPGDLTQASLQVDDHDRIVRETLTAPHHLVTRTLLYPEPDEE